MSRTSLPINIEIEHLHGPNRNKWPEDTFREDVVFSPNGEQIALAYSISEISIYKEVGHILWARIKGGYAEEIQNPKGILALCWHSPWCHWVNNHIFLFKVWYEHKRKISAPLVAIDLEKGFQLIPGSNSRNSWVTDICEINGKWTKFSQRALISEIKKNV